MALGAAARPGDESSSIPDSRPRTASSCSFLGEINTVTHTPADDHGSDDWFPPRIEQGATGWVLGGDDHPQRSQQHEEGANQR